MPRSRRRHHSRSRSRSRSHSHDRDRDAKRRKVDNVDSPAQKRSVSSEPPSPVKNEEVMQDINEDPTDPTLSEENEVSVESGMKEENADEHDKPLKQIEDKLAITPKKVQSPKQQKKLESEKKHQQKQKEDPTDPTLSEKNEVSLESEMKEETTVDEHDKPLKQIEDKLAITPKKVQSPKQQQKKLESEKKRQQKQLEREEREKKRQEEKERARLEKEQLKKEKDEQKAKERERKRKEREEKEAKRKEREEREEAKRKEREQEKVKRQQEMDEKNREKQKLEEQKQKAAQAFVNFFVAKKTETKLEEGRTQTFMPFEVKSDMRLAPPQRRSLTDDEKKYLTESLNSSEEERPYLKELKEGKSRGKCEETWPYEEDVMILEEEFGESICEDKQKLKKMRVKFLMFHQNRRPPFCGTWRKKSKTVKGRRPFAEDKIFFDYEVDSDDDWEEEEQGESLNGSDDEEKENEIENDEYEVDNEFFVPHGHLSDDEVDDEECSKLSPESHKQKLKLLKDEFDEDMQTKINKMKPRSIGCIWYNKDRTNVDDALDRHLRPLAMITDGVIIIKKRKDSIINTPGRKNTNELRQDLVPVFLKLIDGNVRKATTIVEEFINYMHNNDYMVEVSKAYLRKCLKQFAQWKRCADEGPMFNKYCWCVEEDVKKKYNSL